MQKYFTGAFYFFCLFVYSQTITVVNESTKEAIPNVEVWVGLQKTKLKTDSLGMVNVSSLKMERWIILKNQDFFPERIQPSTLDNQQIIELEESFTQLRQLIISANKWQQLNSQIPGRVLSLNEEEIQFQNSQTTADLLGSNGGVFIQKSQLGGGSPMIRGFAANRVLISVDGVRMNNAIFRSGNLQNLIALDNNTLERTEVLLGPGSLIYGSDAIGGVMAMHTRDALQTQDKQNQWNGSALLRYSTANEEKTAGLRLGYSAKKWASLSTFSYSDFDNQIMGKHGRPEYLRNQYIRTINGMDEVVDNPDPQKQIGSGYEQYNLMQKFQYAPSDQWKFTYGLHYSSTNNVPRYDRLIDRRNGELRFAQWDYGPQTWLMNHLNIKHENETMFYSRFSASLAHQFFEESRISRRLNNDTQRNQIENVNVFSFNLDFEKKFNEKNILRYGGEVLFNNVGSEAFERNIFTDNRERSETRYPDDSKWNSYAVYASHEVSPNKNITLQGGIRYNYVTSKAEFNNEFFNFPFTETQISTGAFNGNLGAVFRPGRKWELRTLFSTGFRAPNIDDIGKVFDSEPGAVIVPNPDLEFEYAYNGEIGISKIFGSRLRIDVTAYYTEVVDALVRDEFQFNGQDSIIYDGELSQVLAIQNAASIKVMGIEGEIEWYPTPHLNFRGIINYQDGDEEQADGDIVNVRHVAPLFGQISMGYNRNNWRTRLFANYNGEISYDDLAPSERNKPHIYAIDENGNPFSPSWYTINFRFAYNFTQGVQLNLGLDNITDQRYRPYSSGIVAAGRNLIISASYTF